MMMELSLLGTSSAEDGIAKTTCRECRMELGLAQR